MAIPEGHNSLYEAAEQAEIPQADEPV